MKPEDVTIIQIVSSPGSAILGLGDDGQIYRWIPSDRSWAL